MLDQRLIDDVMRWASELDLAFSDGVGGRRQVPFTLTPSPIAPAVFSSLKENSSLLGKLTQALSEDGDTIENLHAPLTAGDAFFAELLSIHRELHHDDTVLPRVPLLLQRSDFMLDVAAGPQLVECNSIAAGMAPFGEQIHHLHSTIRRQFPAAFSRFTQTSEGGLVSNPAIEKFADALTIAAQRIRREHQSAGAATFLMVVQDNEDNIFDQHLLERALVQRGVRTFRRTFRELHAQLSSGPNQRLLLQGEAAVDVVYLRAGYQYRDYLATDLDTRRCCDALRATRIFIERHRVAVNATVDQQLATSKRSQQFLTGASVEQLGAYGLDRDEATAMKSILTEMRSLDRNSVDFLSESEESANWVLKNQGEGGGHCLFDKAMVQKIDSLNERDYAAWTLMRRLRPVERAAPTVIVRNGNSDCVAGLVSELGLFTAHFGGDAVLPGDEPNSAYLGYLVRSKPPGATEGGIHSGYGALDSLIFNEGSR